MTLYHTALFELNGCCADVSGHGCARLDLDPAGGDHISENFAGDDQIADLNVANLIDLTFIRRLEDSGFMSQLQARYRE